jgi:hypothetical protein
MLAMRWHRSSQDRVLKEDCKDVADERDWRRDCAAGERERKRQ